MFSVTNQLNLSNTAKASSTLQRSKSAVNFGQNDNAPEAPVQTPPKRKLSPLATVLLSCGTLFIAGWATLFLGLGYNFFRTASKVSEMHQDSKKGAVGFVKPQLAGVGLIDIPIQKKNDEYTILAGGMKMGSFKETEGRISVYTADKRLIGYADDDGKFEITLLPEKMVGQVNEKNQITLNKNLSPIVQNAGTVDLNGASLKVKAAAALAVIGHPDNINRRR